MSKIALEGNASGTGTFTIASPNSNSNFTLNLPTSSGTVVVTGGAQTIEFAAGSAASPSITFTGDTNTGIFSPAADTIAFAEGGAESMRIDSSGRVGIGTSSPTWRLEVAGNNGSEFKVSRGTNEFGVSLSNNAGGVVYVGAVADSPLALMTNATERVRINSSGTVILQGGSTSATGVGITFPATQSASSNANTLDDYEEGTWTPIIRFGGATTGITYSEQIGTYVKIGRIGIISMVITLTNKGSATGAATIDNLPFSVTTDARGGQMCATYSNFTNTVYGVGFYASGTTIELIAAQINSVVGLTNTYFQNNTGWRMTGVYIID